MTLANRRDVKDLVRLSLALFPARAMLSTSGPGFVARLLGDYTYFRRRGKRRDLATRIDAGLGGGRPTAELNRYARDVFRGIWASDELFTIVSCARSAGHWKSICAQVQIEGLEHLQDALTRGRGVILWETRFGLRLLAKLALIERGFRLTQIHSSAHGGSESGLGQRVIRRAYRHAASSIYDEIVDVQEGSLAYLRHLSRLLRANAIVCSASLGNMGQKFAPVEILGQRMTVATGVVTLARTSGAPLIPIFCFRDPAGTHRLVLEPPLTEAAAPGSDSLSTAATIYARMLERYVLSNPGQWAFWLSPPHEGQ